MALLFADLIARSPILACRPDVTHNIAAKNETTAANIIPLSTRLLSAKEVDVIDAAHWESLSANALVQNPFYSRNYVKGGLSTIDAGCNVSAFAVFSPEGDMVGLFPLRAQFGIGFGAQNIYQFNGAPLVHKDHAEKVVLAWLIAVRDGPLPACCQLPDLELRGPLFDLITVNARRLGLSLATTNSYRRAQLTRLDGGFEQHLAKVLSKSRRKELERCLRRLREKGALRFERATTTDDVRAALETFLDLESQGWKGKAGTAFLSRSNDARFAREAFRNDGDGRGAIIDSLLLDDQVIAMSINITNGSTLFTPKCTYYEPLRSFAPGLVLEYLVIDRFYSEHTFVRMDAATTADGHVVQGLWNENVPIGTLFVGSRTTLICAAVLARFKADLKAKAKRLRDSVKTMRQTLSVSFDKRWPETVKHG